MYSPSMLGLCCLALTLPSTSVHTASAQRIRVRRLCPAAFVHAASPPPSISAHVATPGIPVCCLCLGHRGRGKTSHDSISQLKKPTTYLATGARYACPNSSASQQGTAHSLLLALSCHVLCPTAPPVSEVAPHMPHLRFSSSVLHSPTLS